MITKRNKTIRSQTFLGHKSVAQIDHEIRLWESWVDGFSNDYKRTQEIYSEIERLKTSKALLIQFHIDQRYIMSKNLKKRGPKSTKTIEPIAVIHDTVSIKEDPDVPTLPTGFNQW
jgi:cell shape-determining protein MreC